MERKGKNELVSRIVFFFFMDKTQFDLLSVQ